MLNTFDVDAFFGQAYPIVFFFDILKMVYPVWTLKSNQEDEKKRISYVEKDIFLMFKKTHIFNDKKKRKLESNNSCL